MKDIFKDVYDYMVEDNTMNFYTYKKDIFYKIAFEILSVLAIFGSALGLILMYVCFPIWIFPYAIYRAIKNKKAEDNE